MAPLVLFNLSFRIIETTSSEMTGFSTKEAGEKKGIASQKAKWIVLLGFLLIFVGLMRQKHSGDVQRLGVVNLERI